MLKALAATSMLLLFQNCGPAKLKGGTSADSSSLGNRVGTKISLTELLKAPQEVSSNVLFPSSLSVTDFDYALSVPVLENVVLKQNDFTRIEWIHGPSETIVAVGDGFSGTGFTSDMLGLYYVFGYREDAPYLLARFRLINKGSTTLPVTSVGAVLFSQTLVQSDSINESFLVLADAPSVDLTSLRVTLKSSGAVIDGKRALYVTKKLNEAVDLDFELVDKMGLVLKKTVTLPSRPSPTPTPTPTMTKVLTLVNPNPTASAGSSFSMTTQFNAVPMASTYAVFIQFVDITGVARSDMTINYFPTVPTTQWNGLVQYTLTVSVPVTLPAGKYTVRMGLYDSIDRVLLAPGPGVTEDTVRRYIVGTFTRP
jgi:hypothetical protein